MGLDARRATSERHQPPEVGIYRGGKRAADARTVDAGRSPAAASILAFIWPGLGHAYAGRRIRAVLFALPPLLLLIGAAYYVLESPEAFALRLLAPLFALGVVAVIAIHALWRVVAIVDAWAATRSKPAHRDGSVLLVAVLSLAILATHGFAAYYVQAVNEAGGTLFTGDTTVDPSSNPLDDLLGGGTSSGGTNGGTGGNNGGTGGGTGEPGTGSGDPGTATPQPDAPAPGQTTSPDFPNPQGLNDDDDDWNTWGSNDPGPGTPSNDGRDPAAGAPEIPRDGPISVLIIGTDAAPGRTHSLTDTLIVATYFPERNQVSMISIPRDTGFLPMYDGRVFGPRVNTLLSRASRDSVRFPDGGIGTLVREVEYIVGVPIHYWAVTNIPGFRDLVNAVGGVEITLDKAIADASWDLYLEPGTYFMRGDEIMAIVRSRRGPGNSDWERARRQQKVLRAIANRLKDPSVAVRMPEILNAASNLLRTNVPRGQVADLFALLDGSAGASTESYVLAPNRFANRIPPEQVNGRYMTQLDMAAVRRLSIDLFGQYSRYSR